MIVWCNDCTIQLSVNPMHCSVGNVQSVTLYSRVDTDVLMEVGYSCNFLAVSDSSTCPDIGTS